MNCVSWLFLLFIVILTIHSDVIGRAQHCVFEYPFRWIAKKPTCQPYDYCLAFDDQQWRTLQFATKTAYHLNRKSSENLLDFGVKSEYAIQQFKLFSQ